MTGIAADAILTGFAIGLGLVLSIGPQNLHLIRSGAVSAHGWATATTGYCSEIVIFLAAISSVGAILREQPDVALALNALGTGFLIWCGLKTLRSRGQRMDGLDRLCGGGSLRTAILGMLSVTWLNPLVFLEVGLIAGAFSLGFDGSSKVAFAAGFLAASAMRFYGWSLLGQRLGPWLRRGNRLHRFNTGAGAVLLLMAAMMILHGIR